MKDYRGYSFWLETAGDLTPRPSLPGPMTVDVAILGAGFTGLWTAYYLLGHDPSLRVVILEKEIAGFGASGRNGSWCSSVFPVSPRELVRRFGRESTLALADAMRDTVDEVDRVCIAEGINPQFVKGGCLRLARGRQQLPALEAVLESYRLLGIGERVRMLSPAETAERVRVNGVVAGLYAADCATVHPGRLVRGLATAVERRGGTVFEQTEVTGFTPGAAPRLRTAHGDVQARAIVLAGEAYLTRLPQLHRQLLPLYSLIVLTEPLGSDIWAEIGWKGHECISSMRYTVDYLARTADDRILFGSRGAPYHWDSRIEDQFDRHPATHEMIRRMVVDWFPSLRGVSFTHTWGGPVGMPRDWMPSVQYDSRTGIAAAFGYTGQGVATSNLSGRILADLIAGRRSALGSLPQVGHRPPLWEPEPLRWLAVRYAQHAFEAVDRRAERSGRPPSGKSIIERLARH
ncbi:MAG TPA: FAD-dependent oxidoreductase [Chloroflexota bacterium]|nr:FAD-dependent oxidoreductase [Chloroflexota bacterium]